MRNLKRALSLTLASVMLLGMMVVGSSAAGYPDVSEEENIEAIEVLQAVGVMGGDENGNFNPDDYVTREQMAVIMSQLLNLDYNYYKGTNPFSDVPEWAAPYVAACAANGVTAGIGGGLYGSKQNIQAVQAALMMLKALGYFQYAGDYGDSYVLATVKQGTEIGLFDGIDSNADSALTRNQVAQMALNALKAEMVSFTGDPGATIPTANGDVVIGYRAEYTPRTSTEAKYNAIEGRTSDVASDLNHKGQYYIQLGEQLYDGELKLYNNRTDDFGRPSRYWEYDGKAIGTYVKKELLKQEWTVEVTGKDFYDLLGSDVIKDYTFDVTIDGVSIDEKTGTTVNNTVLTDNAASYFDETYMAKTYKSGVGKTGKGVLTQVFVDPDSKHVDVAVINTYLAKATADYSEKKDEASFDVYGLKKTGSGSGNEVFYKYYDAANKKVACETDGKQAEKLTVSGEDFAVEGVKKDDIFLVTEANGEIKTMAEPQIIASTALDAFSLNKYVVSGGTQYDYNTTIDYDPDVLEDYTSSDAGEQLKDIEYNLYLDAYGYLIGVDVVEANRNYIFLTGIDQGDSNLNVKTSEAAGILLDGTFINFKMNMTDSRTQASNGVNGTNKFSGHPLWNTWCTYTVDKDGSYTLKEVGDYDDVFNPAGGVKAAKAGQYADMTSNGKTIDPKRLSLYGDTSKFVYGNDNSVYILAELKEVAAKNAVAGNYPVPDDGSVDTTSNSVAIGQKVVIIGGVDNYGVGIDNIKMKTFDNASQIPTKAQSSSPAYPGWIYTLFDNDGYVIGAVVVGEDDGTSKNLVYVNSGSTKNESYNREDDEHTWFREVIADGVSTDLKEVDSGLSKLKSMNKNTWYEVTYKADGSVKDVRYAYFTESGKKVGATVATAGDTPKGPALTQSYITGATPGEFINHIEFLSKTLTNASKTTYLYEEVWGEVTTRNEADNADVPNKAGATAPTTHGDGSAKGKLLEDNRPSLKGGTLYVDTAAEKGFYVAENVKSVLIQTNGGDTKTEYGENRSDLESMLRTLNFKNGTYLFKISAVINSDRATTVIIHDWNEGEATGNDKDRNPGVDTSGQVEIYVNFYEDADAKTGQHGTPDQIIHKAASSTGRLTLTLAEVNAKLPAGYEVDTSATTLPMSLTVKGTGSGYAEADIQIVRAERKLQLPVDYKYSWDADDSSDSLWEAKVETAYASADNTAGGVTVPVGATVTVKVDGSSTDQYYILDPTAPADAKEFLTQNGTFEIEVTADTTNDDLDFSDVADDKYHKITGVTATGTAAGLTGDKNNTLTVDAAVTAGSTKDANGSDFVKENTAFTVTFTLKGDDSTEKPGQTIKAKLGLANTIAESTAFPAATAADLFTGSVTVGTTATDATVKAATNSTSADIALAYTLED